MDLRTRWLSLCDSLGAHGDAGRAFDELSTRYREAHRAYHNLAHLEHCFAELDGVHARVADLAAIALAIFFHDSVYSTGLGAANEEKSAELAERICGELGIEAGVRARVCELILATKRHAGLRDDDADGALFLDIDMAILGQERFVFEEYEANVRREFAWVPDWLFRRRRAQFLRALLAREAIFASAVFHDRYEARARENLARSLVALQGVSA